MPIDSFRELGLGRTLCRALQASGYTSPTPIQRAAIPPLLDDRDVLGCAQTGTGKTAAFALPILQCLLELDGRDLDSDGPLALVLAPTRELAAQIGESFERYAQGTPVRTVVVFGGVKRARHVAALAKRPQVLVATPGRLLDLLSTRELTLRDVEHVVLDEADRMLDMGFIHDMRRIVRLLPKDRQTLLFSATMPREIEKLAGEWLRDPERIAVDPVSSTREPIVQYVCKLDQRQKIRALVEMLRSDARIDRALVFTRTKHAANRVAEKLRVAGFEAAAIHGNKSQSAREKALEGFKQGSLRVVVATDLAARGIDVKQLSHVINFDLPSEPETYVHRVGRTGRAGESGVAVAFCSPDEQAYLQDIERLIQKRLTPMQVELTQADDVEPMLAGEREHGASSRSASRSGGSNGRSRGKAAASQERPASKGAGQGGRRRPRGGRRRKQTASAQALDQPPSACR